jgi:hypothetical protein
MSVALILQTFRSRTVSRSTRAAFSRSIPVSVVGRARHYSEETPKAEKEDGKDGNKAEDSVLNPDQEKLKAKDAEVIDLTVRHTERKGGGTDRSLTGTPPLLASRLSKSAAQCCSGKGADARFCYYTFCI